MAEWSHHFFEGAWQEVQLASSRAQDNLATAERIARVLELGQASRVLDAPCGDGRISVELAANGHRVTGIDITERFLDEARRKADARGVAVRWEQRDMRELPYKAEFDAVVNFGGSFGYFDDDQNSQVAASAWRALRPGGRLLVDAHSPETIFPRFRERHWFAAGDHFVVSENRYNHETGRLEGDWTVISSDGTRENRRSSMRFYTYRELADLLKTVGFEQIEGYDSDGTSPFRLGSIRLLMVATKNE